MRNHLETGRKLSISTSQPSRLMTFSYRLALMGVLLGLAADSCGDTEAREDLREQAISTAAQASSPIQTELKTDTITKVAEEPAWKTICLERFAKEEKELKGKRQRWQPTYESFSEYAKKMTPEEFETAYKHKEDIYDDVDPEVDKKRRYMLILQQIATGNAESDFHSFEIPEIDENGEVVKNGSVLKMKIISGLKVHGFTVQLDGPTAMTAAKLMGGTLPTEWMVDKIYEHAKKNNTFVPFVSYHDICRDLKIECDQNKPPDPILSISAEFALERDKILKEKIGILGIPDNRLTAGFFKDLTHPLPDTPYHHLRLYGGRYENGIVPEPGSNGHHIGYSDYSHGVTVVGEEVELDGKKMALWELYANPAHAKLFGFEPQCLSTPYMTPFLWKFFEESTIKK